MNEFLDPTGRPLPEVIALRVLEGSHQDLAILQDWLLEQGKLLGPLQRIEELRGALETILKDLQVRLGDRSYSLWERRIRMNLTSWLNSDNVSEMLRFLGPRASQRKLRLLGCAYCRQIWDRLGKQSRQAVEVAEKFADGLVPTVELTKARNACEELTPDWAATTVVAPKLTDFWIVASARTCAWTLKRGGFYPDQTRLLRDIFQPFGPEALSSTWLTATVRDVAQAAYDERSFPQGYLDAARLAILADALEEAGCEEEGVLRHLRGPGPHVRGCWAVDLVHGKEVAACH